MAAAEYRIVMSGKLRAGVDPETARARVANLFRIENPAMLDRFFSGSEWVLKKNLDQAKAENYRAALEQAGFDCRVEPPITVAAGVPETDSQSGAVNEATSTVQKSVPPADWASMTLVPLEKTAPEPELQPAPVMALADQAPVRSTPSPQVAVSRPAPPVVVPSESTASLGGGFFSRAWLPVGLMLIGILWLVQHWQGGNTEIYGKEKMAVITVPADVILKFNALPAPKRDPNKSTLENALLADDVSWTEPVRRTFTAGDSPYTVVVKITASAVANGDAVVLSSVGYAFDDKTESKFVSIGKMNAMTGERFTVAKAATPSRFARDTQSSLSISLGRRENIKVYRVEVELWSGTTPLQAHWHLYLALALVGLRLLLHVLL